MALSEAEFTAILTTGCSACPAAALIVEAIVAQRLPLLGGEPYGTPSWGYKGEDLVRGTYEIACEGCKALLFTATACPRCNAEGGVARALEEPNAFPLPVSCTTCGSEQVTVDAYVPARVRYERKRAAKARTVTAPEDEGFHAFRAECGQCRKVAERRDPCPLCAL